MHGAIMEVTQLSNLLMLQMPQSESNIGVKWINLNTILTHMQYPAEELHDRSLLLKGDAYVMWPKVGDSFKQAWRTQDFRKNSSIIRMLQPMNNSIEFKVVFAQTR